jgi:thioredoxin 1
MKVSELRKALDEWNINYSDCFDQESLLLRYNEAKEKQQQETSSSSEPQQSNVVDNNTINAKATYNDNILQEHDKEDDKELLQSIQQMSVKELREELGRRRISRIGLLEKNDLIQAVYKARIEAKSYSVTGVVQPGIVVDVSDDILRQEIQNKNIKSNHQNNNEIVSKHPLLVDVYATWCGPCQLMSKQLNDVANELGNTIRIVKIDSDKYNNMASQLRVQGLPTILLFDIHGNELNRIEGAMMKDQLIQWIQQQQQKQ